MSWPYIYELKGCSCSCDRSDLETSHAVLHWNVAELPEDKQDVDAENLKKPQPIKHTKEEVGTGREKSEERVQSCPSAHGRW